MQEDGVSVDWGRENEVGRERGKRIDDRERGAKTEVESEKMEQSTSKKQKSYGQ